MIALFEIADICDQLQKDDEEWCYFMRYGKPRRNRQIPDLSKPVIPEDNATLERQRKKQRWWQWLNAILSFICLAVFTTILLILFIIFFSVDGKEKQSLMSNMIYSNQSAITSNDTLIPPT